MDLPNVTLRVLSDDEMEEMLRDGDRSNRRLARTGDRVVVLLRRLRFNYGGSLERGRIELSGNVIRRWLKAKPPPPETIPGSEPRLAGALQDQTRSIRARDSEAATRSRGPGPKASSARPRRRRGAVGDSGAAARGLTFSAPRINATARTARMRDSAVEAEGRRGTPGTRGGSKTTPTRTA